MGGTTTSKSCCTSKPPLYISAWFSCMLTSCIYDRDVLNVGLMCTVDLFPVPETVYQPGSPGSKSSAGPSYQPSHGGDYPLTYYPLHPYMSAGASTSTQAMTPPFQIPRRQLVLAPLHPAEIPADAVRQIGDHIITESSKLTPALIGEKFAEPTLVDYQGKKALVFVFGVSFNIFLEMLGTAVKKYQTVGLVFRSSGPRGSTGWGQWVTVVTAGASKKLRLGEDFLFRNFG